MRVLVVDDDERLRRSLSRALRLSGFSVSVAADGGEALRLLDAAPPDAVVLDVAMPGPSGIEVCRRVRAGGDDVPVLILSARDQPSDRIAGLQAGADDYLVKPFVVAELELRIRALLRRRPRPGSVLRVGDLVLDPGSRSVSRAGAPVELTRREFDLLEVLTRNADVVLSRERLLALVWGYDFDVTGNAVDTFVSYLRRKLEAGGQPRIVHTVRGVGFVLRTVPGDPR
ncbi:response regulator transcription factor [Micromonospora maritima]|uniref:response regulator transcription factor n=1 Tax=Micromonospora maritima TaxID=986711 RepID=UPI0037A1F36A